jgi:cobalt-precorrin 5A hydrolase/precorrin-3B C17-methyltransferase
VLGAVVTAAARRVVTISVTAAGAALAGRLPHRHEHGDLGTTVRRLWADVDGLVLVCATGIAVRVVGPLLGDKHTDPAVVCLDDGGRWAIALAGGHRGANELAREVAALVGAEPVVSTATDAAVLPALDALPGWRCEGDVAGVTRAWLDGRAPRLDRSALPDWPLPPALADALPVADAPADDAGHTLVGRIVVSDRAGTAEAEAGEGVVLLRPGSLVVGIGSSSGADADGIDRLVTDALAGAGWSLDAVGLVVSVDLKRDEPGIVALADRLGVDLRTFPAEVLARQDVPTPSSVVADAVGTASVAEAAALVAAGPGGRLVVTKRKSGEATVAVARRSRPEGHLAVVGLGPGDAAWRAPAAAAAVRQAEVVVGYDLYVDLAADLVGPHHQVVRSPIGAEADRCAEALRRAAAGQRVALVCSGDPGIFAMASLVLELAPEHGDPPVTIVPGITAAHAAAAVLGAPLGHDHAAVSLSDLLTPWEAIERRLHAVAEGDLVVSFYNPRSQRRTWQLPRAVEILAAHRPPECPVAVVTDVGRTGRQHVVRTTLASFDPAMVGMLSLVVVGSTTTRWIGDRMVTPRGYKGPAEGGTP